MMRNFEDWLEMVNYLLEDEYGVGLHEAHTYNFGRWYDMGYTPGRAAWTVAEDEGWDQGLYLPVY